MHSDSITDLVPTAVSGTEQMAEWSDEKKADFVKTFEDDDKHWCGCCGKATPKP